MRCERCGKHTKTDRYEVDGFTGQLCRNCRETWEQLRA